jgi:hypothetical protein
MWAGRSCGTLNRSRLAQYGALQLEHLADINSNVSRENIECITASQLKTSGPAFVCTQVDADALINHDLDLAHDLGAGSFT